MTSAPAVSTGEMPGVLTSAVTHASANWLLDWAGDMACCSAWLLSATLKCLMQPLAALL